MSPSVIAGEFAGRYTVERELGRGATSTVWLARDRELGGPVALKILREELASDVAAERFLREVRVTAQLHHPHIVPVLNSGTHEGRLFFVLPYLDGGTLRSRLERDKQLPVAEVVAIGLTIASALASAHEKNLLHRDVKPENILFTGGQACLADFGIARAIIHASGESTTSTGLVRGTPAYMSPEQASGDRDYDGRSDLYSLACVLYEALAGIPAFVGATSQQIVAQRLLHEPRPVRVFRPSVSVELEAVLAKALATSPADRYQTVKEFLNALGGVPVVPTQDHASMRPKRRFSVGLAIAIASVAIVVATLVAVRTPLFHGSLGGSPVPDTSRVAILPFDGASAFPDSVRPEDLISEGLRRWRGLRLVESFEMGDALRRLGAPRTLAESQRFALALGAGRFVRGEVSRIGNQRSIMAALFDTRSDSALHQVRFSVAAESASALSTFQRLGDSLVLRSRAFETNAGDGAGEASLPVAQLMLGATAALRNWNLPGAESLYVRALALDPTSARAALWVAQLRAWQPESRRDEYAALAHRAAADTARLTTDERAMAVALGSLSDQDFPTACAQYKRLTVASPRAFAGWYGLGRCYDLDRIVVPDSASPTHWRYRSSYQRALDAYITAFELLPSVYRSYEGGAYARLRAQLYTSARYRRAGVSAKPNPRYFGGVPTLDADSLAFLPQPVEELSGRARSAADVARIAAAIEHNRALFRRITSGWAAAFPGSAGAKEGLALSLEMQGESAAIDTVRATLRLVTDPRQRLRLLTSLVWLDVKFGMPGDVAKLSEARSIADSLLRATVARDAVDADLLGRLAALSGKCSLSGHFARLAAQPLPLAIPVSPETLADINEEASLISLGCPLRSGLPSLDALADHMQLAQLPPAVRSAMEPRLLAPLVRNAEALDPVWAERLAGGDFLISSRLALLRGANDSAFAGMRRIEEGRQGAMRGDVTPDAAFPESRVWLALGDSAKARGWLDRSLGTARYFAPLDVGDASANFVLIASFMRAAALRSDLAVDPVERRRWATAVATLWGGADSDLQSVVARMRVRADK